MHRSKFAIFLTTSYAVCIFITSSENSMRVMSMTACNLISIAMAAMLLAECAATRKIIFADNPMIVPLSAATVWAGFSLLLARLSPSTAIPVEAYSYVWTTGLNSPELRGVAFLGRLLLGIVAFHFIYRTTSTQKGYFPTVKAFSWAYVIFCSITFGQIVAYHVFNYPIGQLFVSESGSIRIGSYIGEPSVLGGVLASGYFLFIPFLKLPTRWPRLPAILRWYGFIIATICLFYAMSASVITAVLIAYLLTGQKRSRRLMGAGLCMLALVLMQAVYNLSFDNPIIGKIHNELTTVNIRSLSWLIGLKMWLASLWWGVGIGQSPFFNGRYMLYDIDIPFDIRIFFDYTAMRHPPMNSYIEWIAETGSVGAVILAWAGYSGYRFQKQFEGEFVSAIRWTFGMALGTLLIAANSFPGAIYLAHLGFVLAVYFGGFRAYHASPEKQDIRLKLSPIKAALQ